MEKVIDLNIVNQRLPLLHALVQQFHANSNKFGRFLEIDQTKLSSSYSMALISRLIKQSTLSFITLLEE